MSDHPYDLETGWDWFPRSKRQPDQDAFDTLKARENSAAVAFGEIGLVLAAALGMTLLIKVLLAMLHVN